MWWYVLQIAVFFGVIASNVEWQWTDNGLAAAVIAGFCAYAASCLVYSVLNWRVELVPRNFRKGLEQGSPTSRIGSKRVR